MGGEQEQSQSSRNTNVAGARNDTSVDVDTTSIGVGLGGKGGDASSRSSSSSESYSEGSNSESYSRTGDARSSSGGNETSQGVEIDARDQSVLIYEDAENPVNSAAAVFAQQCQTGLSGQVANGGFSVINSDQFCDYVKAAQLAQAAYHWEMAYGSATCADEASIDHGEGAYADLCVNEKAMEYLDDYRMNVDHAMALVDYTEATGWIDRVFGQLIRPIAVVAGLILLL